ncbi:MAG: hypothetical protein RLZZ488_2706 [Pseudomonadota bacterium]
MKLVYLIPLTIGLCVMPSCKFLSLSEPMTRTAQPIRQPCEPCFLAFGNGEICQMSAKQCESSRAFLDDFRQNPPPTQRDVLQVKLVQTIIQKDVQSAKNWNTDLERWALKKFMAGKK